MSTPRDEPQLTIIVGTGDQQRQLTASAGEEVTVAPSLGWVVIALDCSWSMDGYKLTLAKEGVTRFIRDAIARHYQVELVLFSDKAQIACPFTDEPHRLGAALSRARADNSTNGRDAMKRARADLERRPGVRAIVLFTDGYFDDFDGALAEAERAKEAGIDIVTIGTEDADTNVLAEMASRHDLAKVVPDSGIADALENAVLLLPPTT